VALSLTDPLWTSFVEGHPSALPFHHPAWSEVLATAYRFDAYGLALVDADARIEAALPLIRLGRLASRRRGVSLPFTDWCPPLIAGGVDPDEVALRLEQVRRAASLASLEVRDGLAGGVGYGTVQGYRHVLALGSDPDAVFAGFDSSRVKRKLRRADREGVTVRRSESARELLDVFYPLHVATRRRLGVPVQPRRFFEALGQRFLERGLGFVVTARRGDDPVSSAVILAWNRSMIYKFSASDRTHGDIGAGQAVVWEAVRWGCENGHLDFDFGRTELGHEGLRVFKRAWGGEERDLTYTVLADRQPQPGSGRALKVLGPVIRNSPEIVTRVIGWAGYRHTA
jgi:CelD/BcsL family acetyltransferase involved in cellulose biosynthesis